MTLADRNAIIDRAIHNAELVFPCADSAMVFEIAIAAIALEYGLVVTPEEIVRVLSKLVEAHP